MALIGLGGVEHIWGQVCSFLGSGFRLVFKVCLGYKGEPLILERCVCMFTMIPTHTYIYIRENWCVSGFWWEGGEGGGGNKGWKETEGQEIVGKSGAGVRSSPLSRGSGGGGETDV